MKSCANRKKFFPFSFFVSSCHVMTLDYSDENGNVSGGESEDEGRKKEQNVEHRHSHDNEISTMASHHDHDEIEKSTSTETTTTMMPMKRNHSMPCDTDNGGCDHSCQMVIDEYDTEPRIQCSCYIGYTLDENDGRRCHGMITFPHHFISFLCLSFSL